MHLYRYNKYGDPAVFKKAHEGCSSPGCVNPHFAKKLCSSHYNQYRSISGYKTHFQRKPRTRFMSSKRAAKARGLEWTIPYDEFLKFIDKVCSYCGGALPKTRAGLDRKDNSKGYVLDNVVPCCSACNQLKSNVFTYDEFVDFSKTELFQRVLTRIHASREFHDNQRRLYNKADLKQGVA